MDAKNCQESMAAKSQAGSNRITLSISEAPVKICETCHINPVGTYSVGDGRLIYRKQCQVCMDEADAKNKEIERLHNESRRRAEIEKRLSRNIPKLFSDASIENIPQLVREIINSLRDGRGLFLFGPTGCGKSHILAAVAKDRIKAGLDVVRWNWEQLLNMQRARFGKKNGKLEKYFERLINCDLLIIDDLGGSVCKTDYGLRTLYLLFDGRIETKKPTFFATNRTPDQIGKLFDDRIYSRIVGHCEMVQIGGADRRLNMNSPSLFDINKGDK